MSQMTRAIGVALIGLLIAAALATHSFAEDRPPASNAAATACVPCSEAEQKAEFDRMMDLYRAEVKQARDNGYQCGNDPNYSDPGLGTHKVGNCADWAATSWRALVQTTRFAPVLSFGRRTTISFTSCPNAAARKSSSIHGEADARTLFRKTCSNSPTVSGGGGCTTPWLNMRRATRRAIRRRTNDSSRH